MGVVDWISHHLPFTVTIGFTVIIIIFGTALIGRREKHRMEELDAWAATRGWTTEKVGSKTETGRRLKERLLAAVPKGEMRSGSADALWTGVYYWRPTTVADYSYSVATGAEYAGMVTYKVTIVVVGMVNRYPPFRIMTVELARAGWGSERSLTLIPELYPRLRVTVENPAVASRLLEARIYDLLADKDFGLLDLRSQDLLLIWRGSLKVTNLAARLDATTSIANLIERAVS
jgi:hypothetical protein